MYICIYIYIYTHTRICTHMSGEQSMWEDKLSECQIRSIKARVGRGSSHASLDPPDLALLVRKLLLV